ncbi:exocrine gland-secreted peptide 1-like isoform X1 [Mesocricetus auratus]|uniref:Exocrine gland-secreted peptide 1-like isoform X1 n=1 Tax=Mesocricetus auratus TaxID=10036 RepID=A0ABM2W415_MESAU|nr:exocrine gland-secreted peptide 1-like isoform X1 [Mesocricetus auratus]
MASFPVMLFLISLLFPSMLTKGRVLTHTQKESIISADHKTRVKTDLDKIDCPCELNIKDILQRSPCASHQYQTALEDPTNDNKHKLDLSILLTSLRKCCDYQGDPVNFSNMVHRLQGTRVRHQQEYMSLSLYPLEECLNLAMTVLLFH